MTDPRYPIGPFALEGEITPARREGWIAELAEVPASLRAAAHGLTESQFDTPYREGGWTVRQVVHHVPDSHLNAYVRLKLTLTENEPTIKPYAEERWAELIDGKTAAPEVSLTLLESVHTRWVMVWKSLTPDQFARRF